MARRSGSARLIYLLRPIVFRGQRAALGTVLVALVALVALGNGAPPAYADEAPASSAVQLQPTRTATSAQADQPAPAVTPAPGGAPERSDGSPGANLLPVWLRDPAGWASEVFAQSLATLLRSVADMLRGAVDAVLGSAANFVTRTPAVVTYESPTVRGLWAVTRAIANAALAAVALWGGFNLLLRDQLGPARQDATELFSRLAVGALLANTSLWWGRLFVDANNALCDVIGAARLPAWEQADSATQALAGVLAALVYLVVGLLLVLQQLMRLALIDVLLVLAPLAYVCWILPQTRSWTDKWSSAFVGGVFVQFLQVATLKLGSSLVLELAPMGEDAQIVTLLLGVAVLALTIKLPQIVQGHVEDGLGFVRYYAYRRGARTLDAVQAARGGK